MIRYWVLLLWTVNVFAWTEVKNGAECADFHHKDYMFNALNEKFTRASDKIDQCERWCLRNIECKSFALWFAHSSEADAKAAYCSLCATEEYIDRPIVSENSGWFHHRIDETERISECSEGLVESMTCSCGDTDCTIGSICEHGECHAPCDHGVVTGKTCTCESEKCEQDRFCDAINQQCLHQCSREKCNHHGQDVDPTDGCDTCECDLHFYGDQCQYTNYQSIKEMKLAFCHPVLFGQTNVTRLETFLDYYRRIGFNRFFFWSEPNSEVEQFFTQQDDVTFQIYNEDYEVHTHEFFLYPPGYGGGDKDWYHGQNVAIHSCLKLTQEQGFDWVQFGDSDEFVYFTGNEDLRSFLARFQRFSYISLGKMMHTRQYCAEHQESPNDLFDLLYRPDSPFCSFEDGNIYRSYEYCETFFGRRKYIIQPHFISKLQIHEPVMFEGIGMDLSTDVAHIKELRGYNEHRECEYVTSDPYIEISNEAQFRKSMHGGFENYQVQIRQNTTMVTLIKDFEFDEWLHHLYDLPYTKPEDQDTFHDFDHVGAFEDFYQRSLEDPCSNDAVLFQYWDVCGFGCATNTLVLQILDAYFRGQTFSFSSKHSDYQRYFRFIFEDKAFPICDDEEALSRKPRVQPINPHVFYKTHVHHGRRENALRPLFHHIYHDILWKSLKVWLQDEIETRFDENPQLKHFTAIHVRRGDKCIEEAHCIGFEKYYEHVSQRDQPIFLMTDALTEVADEIEECCEEVKDQVYTLDENLNKDANTRAWDDGSSFIDLIIEVSMAGRADSVVCSGSSNLCRLLWALTDPETSIFNMDTKSMLCGDARNVACMAPEERHVSYNHHQFKHWLSSLPKQLSQYASELEQMPSIDVVDDELLDTLGVREYSDRVMLKEAFEKEKKLNAIEDHIVVVLDTAGSHIRRNLQNSIGATAFFTSTNMPLVDQPTSAPTPCVDQIIKVCSNCRCNPFTFRRNLDNPIAGSSEESGGRPLDPTPLSITVDECGQSAKNQGKSYFSHLFPNYCFIPTNEILQCDEKRQATADDFSIYRIEICTESPTTSFPSLTPSTPIPSIIPSTSIPSPSPSVDSPTVAPSNQPSKSPSSGIPTTSPSNLPTATLPSLSPSSDAPSNVPSNIPTSSTPTTSPTSSEPTVDPTNHPSTVPSISIPSLTPSSSPSKPPNSPSHGPTTPMPSVMPTTVLPSKVPSVQPSSSPSSKPSSDQPSISPSSDSPSSHPSSGIPTTTPSLNPSSTVPTTNPSSDPSSHIPTLSPTLCLNQNIQLCSHCRCNRLAGKRRNLDDPMTPVSEDLNQAPLSLTRDECRESAIEKGKSYFSYKDRDLCEIPINDEVLECVDNPSTGLSTNWGIYFVHQCPTTSSPSLSPSTSVPSKFPITTIPSLSPSFDSPTVGPSNLPSKDPSSEIPTVSPSNLPTFTLPSLNPTSDSPTNLPSIPPTSDTPTLSPSSESPTTSPSKHPTFSTPSVSPTMEPLVCDDNRLCYYNGELYYDQASHSCKCNCEDGYGGTNCADKLTLSHQYVFENTESEFEDNKDSMANIIAQRLAAQGSIAETPVCQWALNNYNPPNGRRFLQDGVSLDIITTALCNCNYQNEDAFYEDQDAIFADTDAYESTTKDEIESQTSMVVDDIVFYYYCNPITDCNDLGWTNDAVNTLDPSDDCVCTCDAGYTGNDCSIPVACSSSDCNNNGWTSDLDVNDGCECNCYAGFYGDACGIESVCVRNSTQIGSSVLAASSSSTIDGTDLTLIIEVPIELQVQYIEFHNALSLGYDYPGGPTWTVTEPTEYDDCSREYTWTGDITALLANFDSADLRMDATSITFDVSVEGTTRVGLSDGSYYDRSSATIVPIQVNLAANAVIDLTVNTVYTGPTITAVVTLYEVTDEYKIRMTIALYSLYPYGIRNTVVLDDETLPASFSYGEVSVSGEEETCVNGQECTTDLVVTINPTSCAVSEALLFNFTAFDSRDNVEYSQQSEFVIRADFCDTFLGTLDGLSGGIDLYDANPTQASLTSTSVLYVGGTMYATITTSSAYATIASVALSSPVTLTNGANSYSVSPSGTDLTYSIVDQQTDEMTIAILLDDTYIEGTLTGVSSTMSVDVEVTYSTTGRRLLGLDNGSETLTINHKFELVEEVCGKDKKKGDVDVHECSKGVNIRQCQESGWITIVNNCVHVSE